MITNFLFPITHCRLKRRAVQQTFPDRQWASGNGQSAVRGFTLVEMVIVVAVILLILGIVLPAASTLWKQRRISEAQNTISGMLMTARAKAMESDFGDSGLFFFLDDAGVQRIAAIAQDAKIVTLTKK